MLSLWDKLLNFKSQRGQALLIIVLVLVVATTVGLSIISRTITNLRTAEDQENSQKALAAAEAGVEQAMKTNSSIASSFSSGTSYTTNITLAKADANTAFFLNGGKSIYKNDGGTIWITPYSTDSSKLFTTTWTGNLTVYWGSTNDVCTANLSNTMAALEIVVLLGPKASPSVRTYGFDPCTGAKAPASPARATSESFQIPGAGAILDTNFGTRTFPYSTTISISQGLMVKVIPLYANTYVATVASVNLPLQGSFISSVGTSGNTQRKITVFQGYPEIPSELFPYSLLILPNE